ncbi:hypothetical protein [Xenorhabdus hominickii]|uniref:Uncharacterized protein n=1 Tax=Xenorhabdus hominickii TaxID=351679 RepID=A0A2G0QFH1_XENHO|nr:hypothetical protein [Xenorhabdus hominickii]AOM41930.1 hypothetical protein A9255_16015 [Xenorhabdus hominickii]PHM57909.1 hypothetical protein Xhom_00912 [Xenorhabdus hominickii]
MSEEHLLPAPIITPVKNGVLTIDKSATGQFIEVHISADGIMTGEPITIYNLTVNPIQETAGSYRPNNQFVYSIDQADIQLGNIEVYYVVKNDLGTPTESKKQPILVKDKSATTPTHPDEPFIVMGARYANYAMANDLGAPQRLTAWSHDGQPLAVSWSYVDGASKFYSPFDYSSSTFFYDNAPNLTISVSHPSKGSLTINPINVFGNGGIDSDYPSAFAAFLNDNSMVGWGGPFGSSTTASNINSLTTCGSAYAALQSVGNENSRIMCWGMDVPNNLSGSAPFQNLGAGHSSFAVLNANGYTMHVWGELTGSWSIGMDEYIYIGNKYNFFGYTTYGSLESWPEQIVGQPGSALPPVGNYTNLRYVSTIPAGNCCFITQDGTPGLWGLDIPSNDPVGHADPYYSYTLATPPSFAAPKNLIKFNGVTDPTGKVMVCGLGMFPDASGDSEMISWYFQDRNDSAITRTIRSVDISISHTLLYLLNSDHSVMLSAPDAPDPIVQGLQDVVQVTCSASAYAALKIDGTVVTWGDAEYGGDCSAVQGDLKNVRAIYATGKAFVALTADKKVVIWGNPGGGWDTSEITSLLGEKLTYYKD